jgi:hypothetical protein
MQKIPEDGLRLTFFDKVGLEQLRGLLARYRPLVESDPFAARSLLETWLLSVAVGVHNVHSLRRVDEFFVEDYMRTSLEENEDIGAFSEALLGADERPTDGQPEGIGPLRGDGDESDRSGAGGAKRLLDIVTRRDKRVEVPGTQVTLQQEDVKEAVKDAVITGVKDKRRDESAADKLEAPVDYLKDAVRKLEKSIEALRAVHDDEEFDQRHRASLGVAFKKLGKTSRNLESAFEKYSIPTK